MNIEEAYYFGQCVLNCICDKDSDNGKTVSATNGTRSFTGTVVDKKCTLIVPGKIIGNNNEYTVSLLNGGTAEYSTKVDVGYGDVVEVILAAGYDPIYSKKMLSNLEQVMANTDAGMVPDALAVKALNSNKVARLSDTDITPVNAIGYDESNKKLMLRIGGADAVIPFNSGTQLLWTNPNPDSAYPASSTIPMDLSDYDVILFYLRYCIPTAPYGGNSNVYKPDQCKMDYARGLRIYQNAEGTQGAYGRQVTVSKSGITFTSAENVSYCIPIKIYGIRYTD